MVRPMATPLLYGMAASYAADTTTPAWRAVPPGERGLVLGPTEEDSPVRVLFRFHQDDNDEEVNKAKASKKNKDKKKKQKKT